MRRNGGKVPHASTSKLSNKSDVFATANLLPAARQTTIKYGM